MISNVPGNDIVWTQSAPGVRRTRPYMVGIRSLWTNQELESPGGLLRTWPAQPEWYPAYSPDPWRSVQPCNLNLEGLAGAGPLGCQANQKGTANESITSRSPDPKYRTTLSRFGHERTF